MQLGWGIKETEDNIKINVRGIGCVVSIVERLGSATRVSW